MSNARRFLDAYAQIEDYLRKATNADRHVSFSKMINWASRRNKTIRSLKYDLREYAALRNAIVHDRADGEVIAEPHTNVVEHMEQIAQVLTRPPQLLPLFQRKVAVLNVNTPFRDALDLMQQKDISKLPIVNGRQFVGLLSANTITRWLCNQKAAQVDLENISVEGVLQFGEEKENYAFLSRQDTLFDAVELFSTFEERGKHLEALLITERGKSNEKIIGIMTVSDLPKAIQEIGLNN